MKKLFFLLSLVCCSKVNTAQKMGSDTIVYSKLQSSPNSCIYYKGLIDNLNDSINKAYDFQIRFWIVPNGAFKVITNDFLAMSYKGNNWVVKSYRFRKKNHVDSATQVIERAVPALNYDSVYIDLVKDSLWSINSLDFGAANDIISSKKGLPVFFAEGGINYIIELLTQTSYKRIVFNSPIGYFNETKGVYKEFEKPAKLTSTFMRIMNL